MSTQSENFKNAFPTKESIFPLAKTEFPIMTNNVPFAKVALPLKHFLFSRIGRKKLFIFSKQEVADYFAFMQKIIFLIFRYKKLIEIIEIACKECCFIFYY